MKTLRALHVATSNVTAIAGILLASLVTVVYPGALTVTSVHAAESSGLVFEIKDPSVLQNNKSITIQQLASEDPIAQKLEEYLISKKSPLAPYAAEIIQQPQWKRALAISRVESQLGLRCADNNCSGIGVAPGHASWRKYKTKLDWFKDMCALLEKPIYKEKFTTFKQMRGVYVQPGSDNWVNGATQTYNDLAALEKDALEEQFAGFNQELAINQ